MDCLHYLNQGFKIYEKDNDTEFYAFDEQKNIIHTERGIVEINALPKVFYIYRFEKFIKIDTQDETYKKSFLESIRLYQINNEKESIKQKIEELEQNKLRPMGAILANIATEYDKNKLLAIENELFALRELLRTLG